MTIDPYAPCPGGLNKKIKFCCPDLVSELDKLERMLEGDQKHACLDHINQLEAKYPNRACLETTKALIQGELGMVQEAQQTIQQVLQSQPDNPVALAESAMLVASTQGGRAGIALLQKAMAASGREVSRSVGETFFGLAQVLLGEGHVLAARGHLMWLLRMAPDHREAMQLLLRILSAPSISPLFKTDKELAVAPPDVSWRAEFEAALQMAADGRWLDAAARFGALSERVVAAPELWRNLALVRSWVADDKGAAAALHRLATLAIPLDDAVEAEALALLLDGEAAEDTLDEMLGTYTINDFERVSAALAASKQTAQQPVPRNIDDGQPPPRAIYWLIDRPVPASAAGLTLDDMPQIIGHAGLYGRETDREARLETSYLAIDREKIDALVMQLAPAALTPAGEEFSDRVPLLEHILSWRWRPPDATPA
ncbi:MAG TPA: hypothetical protein VHY20_03960, partial [Pirellulales bacterium]|nr:hypothetical protein [Pirellulales bacterium]